MRDPQQQPKPVFSSAEMQMLCSSALFVGFSRFELVDLLERLELRRLDFREGTTVAGEGAVLKNMGIVLSGHLHVYDAAFKGVRHLVRIVRPGEIVGASMIAERQKWCPAEVTAYGNRCVAALSLEALRLVLKERSSEILSTTCPVSSAKSYRRAGARFWQWERLAVTIYKAFVLQTVFRNPDIWIIAIADFFVYTVRFAALDWGIVLLMETKGLTLVQATTLCFVFEIVDGNLGMVVAGLVTDRFFASRAHRTSVFACSAWRLRSRRSWRCRYRPRRS